MGSQEQTFKSFTFNKWLEVPKGIVAFLGCNVLMGIHLAAHLSPNYSWNEVMSSQEFRNSGYSVNDYKLHSFTMLLLAIR